MPAPSLSDPVRPGHPLQTLRIAIASMASPGGNSVSEQALQRFSEALAARGCDVRFACPEPGPAASAADRSAAGAVMAAQHRALTAWWRAWRPDVVHLQSLDGIG